MFNVKMIDGSPADPSYLAQLYPLVSDAADATEEIGDDELERGSRDFEEFLTGYVELIIEDHSMTVDERKDPDDPPVQNILSAASLKRARKECRKFFSDNRLYLYGAVLNYPYSFEQAGGDFLFTRNGHGAGFWDRGLDSFGDKLTEAAKAWPELYYDHNVAEIFTF